MKIMCLHCRAGFLSQVRLEGNSGQAQIPCKYLFPRFIRLTCRVAIFSSFSLVGVVL